MAKKLIIKKTSIVNDEDNADIDTLKKWTIKTMIIYVLTIISVLLFLTIYFAMNRVDASIIPPITNNLFKVLNIILDATLK